MKEEFDAIKDHHIKDNTILIDDWRCMENTHIDTIRKKDVGFIGKENCFKRLKDINPEYNFYYENGELEDDVLVCKI